jgi:hypothetical protein
MSATTMVNEQEPKLAKPGAGLPFHEWFVSKYFLFPKRFKNTTPEQAIRQFEIESKLILKLARSIPAEQLTERRLVPRLRGLEDSSRFWSVAMAVEHLVIAGGGVGRIVQNLSENNTNIPRVTIPEIKPQTTVDASKALADFETMTADFIATASSLDVNKFPNAKHPHPWFGPLNAHQWLTFAAPHQSIHRAQMKEIIQRLS